MASDEKLQKYVSACGLMSRRAAEAAIREGQFAVNGRVALLGDRIDPQKDVVTYRGEPLTPAHRRKICLLLNKPAGVLATRSDEHGRRTVVDLARENGYDGYLYPVGRLDKDSEGLLLLTDDGELANRVAHPSGCLKKVYTVMLAGRVRDDQLDALRGMRTLRDPRTGREDTIRPVEVSLVERSENASRVRFVLTEGKNRQIRRMCESCGLSVMQLRRVALGPLTLGTLESGRCRPLTKEERNALETQLNGGKNR